MARDLIRTCNEFGRRYPGVAFIFMSSRLDGDQNHMGLSTNLGSTEQAHSFLRMAVDSYDSAKMAVVPPEGHA